MSIRTTISNYTGSTRYKRPTYSRGLQAKPKERERTERERREECQGEKNLLCRVEEGAVSTKSSHIVKYPCILTPVGFFIAHAFFFSFLTLLSIAIVSETPGAWTRRCRHWPRGVFRIYKRPEEPLVLANSPAGDSLKEICEFAFQQAMYVRFTRGYGWIFRT